MTRREDAEQTVIDEIRKRFGAGAIFYGDDKPVEEVKALSTGSLMLDLATGVGGFPYGRNTEVFGRESSGKTTVMQHAVANAQKKGQVAAFIDMEHALDEKYAILCGVDIDKLIISQPDTGEQAMEIAESLVRSGLVKVLVVDSIATLVPRAEVEGDFGDATMGGQARLMSQSMRKLAPIIKKFGVCAIWTNQIRMKIGVMYGSPEYEPGGLAMKHAASLRIRLAKLSEGTDGTRAHIKARVVKNKIAPPYKEAEFDINYLQGIDTERDSINAFVAKKIIEKNGGWYKYKENKWQGIDAVVKSLREQPELLKELEGRIKT